MVEISSKLEVFDFSGGRSPLSEGLTIIERRWNYGNLSYLVANTYDLNFIKIGDIWIFGGVTFDLWYSFLNWDELFQSKAMCENLVWIGWNWRYVNFRGGGTPIRWRVGLHVTCDAHLRTFPSYFGQKSFVKIWFGLHKPFKSYRGNGQKKKSQTRLKTIP